MITAVDAGAGRIDIADPDYKTNPISRSLNALAPLASGLVMARMAGVEDPRIDLAIERSLKMQRFYIGKGAVPYGDHARGAISGIYSHPEFQRNEGLRIGLEQVRDIINTIESGEPTVELRRLDV